jgi:hypothetical protein
VELYCILKRLENVRDELDSTGSESKKVSGYCREVIEISDTSRCGQFLD